jgi:predicted nuclease with TOPRIM domain
VPVRSLVTERNLRSELVNAKEQIRHLREEVTLLFERLARLGAQADIAHGRALASVLDRVEQRASELGAGNHRLHARIVQLETDGHELDETLEARAMSRELMNELNRSSGGDRGGSGRSR